MNEFAKSTHAKRSLLSRSWLLPFDQEIPGNRQNLEANI